MGPSIKYVTLFLANFDPLPCHTLSHIPGPPPPKKYVTHLGFLVGLVQNPGQKPSVQILSQLFAGVFVRGDFSLEGFVRGGFYPFPLVSEYICYDRKFNITLNFMFHMYDKKCIGVASHALYPPSLCHKLSHLLGPSPLERDVLYGRPLCLVIGFSLVE